MRMRFALLSFTLMIGTALAAVAAGDKQTAAVTDSTAVAESAQTLPADIPFMPDMQPDAAQVFVFDTPAGRVAEIVLVSQSSVKEATLFYAENLPALGWQSQGNMVYQRADETLNLSVQATGDGTIISFYLAPNAAQ